MVINMGQFGQFLTSRPAGREAYLAARSYTIPKDYTSKIELDFSAVTVLTPSWIDEFLRGLIEEYGNDNIKVLPSDNSSVQMALKAVESI